MNYRSFSDLNALVRRNLWKIPKDIGLIVGIPRSGLMVANILSLLLNKPLTDLQGLRENRIISSGKTKPPTIGGGKVLVVEDSVNFGTSIKDAKKFIEGLGRIQNSDVVYFSAYVTPECKGLVDIYLEILSKPRVFEWNLFQQTAVIPYSCFDLDGVLCVDPTDTQNDNGKEYRNFIKNAVPYIVPSCPIGCIVTSRLEKYREETEAWLHANNIAYHMLVMFNGTAEDRKGKHADYKADYYKKHDYLLFIESNDEQAKRIYEHTNKPVYCFESNAYYDGGIIYKAQKEFVYKVKRFLKRSRIVKKVLRLVH